MSANSTMTGIHVELIVLAAKTIVMGGSVVDIDHRLYTDGIGYGH